MVVNQFNIFRAAVRPSKTEPVLIVDTDAVLSGSITAQGFESVTGWNPEVVEPAGDLELPELAAGYPLDGLEARDRPTVGEGLSIGASERPDHAWIIVLLRRTVGTHHYKPASP